MQKALFAVILQNLDHLATVAGAGVRLEMYR